MSIFFEIDPGREFVDGRKVFTDHLRTVFGSQGKHVYFMVDVATGFLRRIICLKSANLRTLLIAPLDAIGTFARQIFTHILYPPPNSTFTKFLECYFISIDLSVNGSECFSVMVQN
jgi:hypothetical protein